MSVDPDTCTKLNVDSFSNSGMVGLNRMATFTTMLQMAGAAKTGTLWVVVTGEEPQENSASLVNRLNSVCGVDVNALAYRDSLAFVCLPGYPEKTKWQLLPEQEVPGARVTTTVTGQCMN